MATAKTLARKGRKGYAPRIVADGIDTSSREEEEQLPVRNEKGALQHLSYVPILCPVVSLTQAAVTRTAPRRNRQAAMVVPPMAKVTPPNKSLDKKPVIDLRLSISSSKVLPPISVFVDVLSDVVTSLLAL
jgi:hypothetical protein